MGEHEQHAVVLAVTCSAVGLGFALFEEPAKPVDWGVKSARLWRATRCERFVESLIAFYHPQVLVLEVPHEKKSLRTTWLVSNLAVLGTLKGLTVVKYGREEIEAFFSQSGATSKYAISRTIATLIPAVAPHAPRYRHPWMSQPHSMAAFDAMALALTHYYLTD